MSVMSKDEPAQSAVVTGEIKRKGIEHGINSGDLSRFNTYLAHSFNEIQAQYTDELQRPRCFFPGLTARAVHDPSCFSWAEVLASNSETIRKELLTYRAGLKIDAHPLDLADRGRWDVLDLFESGKPATAVSRACPKTTAILLTVPGVGVAGNAYISVLQGGTHIQAHCGSTNTRLRCHVALVAPKSARMRVGKSIYHWQQGAPFVFDDSFEHEVWNDGSNERIVLLFDFWHPDLTSAERWAIDAARRLPSGLRDIGPVQRRQMGLE